MPNLTKKELRKAAIEAAKYSGFMMAFKKKWWRKQEDLGFRLKTCVVREQELDELAMIAWGLLK